jgi:hypothetical protein
MIQLALMLTLHTLFCLVIAWRCFDAMFKMNDNTSVLVAFAYCGMFSGALAKMLAAFAPFAYADHISVETLMKVEVPFWDLVIVAGFAAFHVIEARKWWAGVPREYQSDWSKLNARS